MSLSSKEFKYVSAQEADFEKKANIAGLPEYFLKRRTSFANINGKLYASAEKLGHGAFGSVYNLLPISMDKNDEQNEQDTAQLTGFVVKKFEENHNEEDRKSSVKEETKANQTIYGYGEAHYFDSGDQIEKARIVMRSLPGENFETKIKKITPNDSFNIFINILLTYQLLHSVNIFQKDIGSANILIDNNFLCYPCDFGDGMDNDTLDAKTNIEKLSRLGEAFLFKLLIRTHTSECKTSCCMHVNQHENLLLSVKILYLDQCKDFILVKSLLEKNDSTINKISGLNFPLHEFKLLCDQLKKETTLAKPIAAFITLYQQTYGIKPKTGIAPALKQGLNRKSIVPNSGYTLPPVVEMKKEPVRQVFFSQQPITPKKIAEKKTNVVPVASFYKRIASGRGTGSITNF